MSRILLVASIFLFPHLLCAQLEYYSLKNKNEEEVIRSMFGGYCEAISGIKFIGRPCWGFKGADSIGLKSGIFMTTGRIPESPAVYGNEVMSTDFSYPGDADISAAANDISRDACGLMVTMEPTVSGSLQMNYIFASDEYPESIVTDFNDRFLFLVSENGGPFVNMGLLPNGSPVSIHTVNNGLSNTGPCTNCSYFIYNELGALPVPYDGLTVPLTVTISLTAGNTYVFKIVVADVKDGLFDSAIYLEEVAVNKYLAGHILSESESIDLTGVAELFFATTGTVEEPILTIPVDTNDWFRKDSLSTYSYFVHYVSDNASMTFPTYYGDVVLWQKASALELLCGVDSVSINALSIGQLNGHGSINGKINSYLSGTKEPFTGANVFLFSELDDVVPIAMQTTDSEGRYEFTSVPNGVYKIYVDIPFIEQEDVIPVVITDSDSTIQVVDYDVNEKIKIHYAEYKFLAYPNPTNHYLTICTYNSIGKKIQIYDMMGNEVLSTVVDNAIMLLNVDSLSEGMYYIYLEEHTYPVKLQVLEDSLEE